MLVVFQEVSVSANDSEVSGLVDISIHPLAVGGPMTSSKWGSIVRECRVGRLLVLGVGGTGGTTYVKTRDRTTLQAYRSSGGRS